MPLLLIQALLPLAVSAIQAYIKNSSTKNDDVILDLTKNTCQYLASTDTNTVLPALSNSLNNTRMVKGV